MRVPIALPRCKPKQDFILVKADPVVVVEETEGGVQLPDEAKGVGIKRTGIVLACGPEVTRAQVGEHILFSAHAGTTIEVDGVELELMRDQSVLAGV